LRELGEIAEPNDDLDALRKTPPNKLLKLTAAPRRDLHRPPLVASGQLMVS
jgi:hypothetical protein